MLHVHVREGRGISPLASRLSCQPCVRVSCGSLMRWTRAVDSHINPLWDQVIHIPVPDPAVPIVFSLVDSNPFGDDTELAAHTLLATGLTLFDISDIWVALHPAPAELHVTFQYAPPGHTAFAPFGAGQAEVAYPQLTGGPEPLSQMAFERPFGFPPHALGHPLDDWTGELDLSFEDIPPEALWSITDHPPPRVFPRSIGQRFRSREARLGGMPVPEQPEGGREVFEMPPPRRRRH
jgi:hypothetical protein